ncbi:MAG: EVE domain-containing protein [Deltaproteobacteria bacterium]|nr:MAG: EVE domain-containing protein [Deltaproteobacteria bacterium]TNF26856.1 MAG: EVE domain-containing protein [Deltaproteobacteria bacterium]
MNYWLMKSEPDVFGIDDLKRVKKEPWDGVRNYQARNYMRDEMKKGDKILFYHSNTDVPGVVGIMEVSKEAFPDHTSWDKKSKYFDPKSSEENPRWFMIEVKYVSKFPRTVSLQEMKDMKPLSEMKILQKGNRLSITPVTKAEFDHIVKVAAG